MAATMNAVAIRNYGAADQLEAVVLPVPTPGPHDLLVKVAAVSVNPVDRKKRQNFGQAFDASANFETPLVLGWDASGTVEAVGADVTLFKKGDQVFFAGNLLRPGSNAEYTLVDERIAAAKPATLSHAEAAAIPLVALTAWEALVDGLAIPVQKAHNGHGPKSILVIAGAGGVGSFAIQIAKRVLGLRVIATASRPESRQFCLDNGADDVISHAAPLADGLKSLGLSGVDYVFITASIAEYLDQAVDIANPSGKIAGIDDEGLTKPFDLSRLKLKRLTLHFELMFTRPIFGHELERQNEILSEVSRLLDAGVLKTTLTKTYPFDAQHLRQAHLDIESNRTVGKIALTL